MMDHFYGIINSSILPRMLEFDSTYKVFRLPQLSIPANECRKTFKVKVTKRNVYNSQFYAVIRLNQNQNE